MPHTPGHFDDTPLVGCAVFTRDGHELGTVKEAGTRAFKVDAPMRADYWLSIGHIAASATTRVVLAFDREQLDDYTLDDPDEVLEPSVPRGRSR